MHVGFSLLTLFPGVVGGSESYARGLLGAYAAGTGPDHVTALVNRHAGALPVTVAHVASYRPGASAPTRLAAMVHAAARPAAAAREVPAGLDVLHHPLTVPIPRLDLPTVTTLHDLHHHELPETFSHAERTFRRWAYDGAARRADVVVTPSEYSRAQAVERLGLDPSRVRAIHSGIDHDRFHARPPVPEAPLPERFVFYPANLWPHKNHERLLAALALLDDVDVALVLSGQTYGRDGWLTEAIERHGLTGRVHHSGHLPADEIPGVYAAAAALVFPSLAEGFGQPPLEAMACGTAVAASTAGSLPEVCGDHAVLFDPRDPRAIAGAIVTALGEGPRPGAAAHARSFTWAAAARGHVEAYRAALERTSSPA